MGGALLLIFGIIVIPILTVWVTNHIRPLAEKVLGVTFQCAGIAMTEYRTERAEPSQADNVASIYSGFGRQLIDAQEVYNENTVIDGVDVHSYGAFMQGFTGNDGKINVRRHVDVTHYVIMKFARDTAMPYYDRLADLERTFENNLGISARRPNPPKVFTGITAIGVILIVISVIMAVINGTAAEGWEIAVCIGFPVITIPVTVVLWLRYKKRSAACDAAYESARQALDEADGLTG